MDLALSIQIMALGKTLYGGADLTANTTSRAARSSLAGPVPCSEARAAGLLAGVIRSAS